MCVCVRIHAKTYWCFYNEYVLFDAQKCFNIYKAVATEISSFPNYGKRSHFWEKGVCAVSSPVCVLGNCAQKSTNEGEAFLTYTLDVFNLCKKISLIVGFSSHLLIYVCFLKWHFSEVKKIICEICPIDNLYQKESIFNLPGMTASRVGMTSPHSKTLQSTGFHALWLFSKYFTQEIFKNYLVLHETCGKLWPLVCQTFIFKGMRSSCLSGKPLLQR